MIYDTIIYMARKVLFFTDIHWGIHANSDKYLSICENTMKWISSLCKERQINTVIFGGDYFDSRSTIDVSTMQKATESLYMLAEDVKNIIMILGNHDIYLKDSTNINSLCAYKGHQNIHVAKQPYCIIGGKLLLLPWDDGSQSEILNKLDINNIKVVISHHNFPKEFFYASNKIKKSKDSDTSTLESNPYGIDNIIIDKLSKNCGVFFSGHIHHKRNVPIKDTEIVIAGSPYETEYGFNDIKCGCFIIDVDTAEYEFIENTYNIKHVEVYTSKFDNFDFNLITNAFVRLRVDTNDNNSQKSIYQNKITEFKPYAIDNAIFEFECASFIGQRNLMDNPLDVIGTTVMSKMDYMNKLIDDKDFTSLIYRDKDGNQHSVDKTVVKLLAEHYFNGIQ